MPDHSGLDGKSLMPGSKSVLSSPLENFCSDGGNNMNFLEPPQTFLSKQKEANISAGNHFLGPESAHSLSFTSLGIPDQKMLPQSTLCMHPAANGFHYENSIFSSSLTEAFTKKLRLLQNDARFGKSLDGTNSKFVYDESLESMKEIEAQTIGDLLPNDDELLSGVIDIECVAQQNSGDEDDLFCSVGGMEMESDEILNRKGASYCHRTIAATNLIYDENPSRALFVRNVNSNIEDNDLRILFEQFGDINAFYSGKKHSGFIIVSYYDIRAARNAKKALQSRLLRQQKLDIQYYVSETIKYQDNAPDNDTNNATLIVFNLESVVSKDDLHQIFGSFGEIKEIVHDPCYENQRAIEFYDVRAAEAALCALNMSIISGKRIKIELGCSGAGWQWRSRKHSSLELEQENPIIYRKSGSPKQSSSVSSGLMTYGANPSGGIDNEPMHSSLPQNLISPLMENEFPGSSSGMNHNISSPIKVTMVGNLGVQSSHELSNSLGQISLGFQSMPTIHPHSLPEFHDGLISNVPFNSLSTMPPMQRNMDSRIADEFDDQQLHRVGANNINCHSFEHKEGNRSCPVNGHHYIFNNSNANFHQPRGSLVWQNLPSFLNNIPAPPPPQLHGLPRGPANMMNTFVPLHHHVGSAPALKPSLWERNNTYAGDCVEPPFFHPGSLGNMGFSASSPMHSLGITSHNMYPQSGVNYVDPSISPGLIGSPSPQQRSHMFHGRSSTTSALASYDAPGERIRSRRSDTSANQSDNKKQFELDIDRIIRGEDPRTTLMIKNIPNKYTSKMLLATIDEHHRGTYDFIYLPIDFKNKCNVGYAFINLTDPKHIIPFYQAFNGKKWEKFNSEKVASLAYARIQGKAALIGHFQNSSLMNEDKRCRPIIFHSDGPNVGDQEPFPIGSHIRSRAGRSRTANNEDHNHRSLSESDFGNGEGRSNSAEPLSSPVESLSSPTKDSE